MDNKYWEVENEYQTRDIEVFPLINNRLRREEVFENMRIIVERNGRPFNYFNKDEAEIHKERVEHIAARVLREQQKAKEEALLQEKEVQKVEEKYWKEMDERIATIRADKKQLDAVKDMVTRKFLLLNIMPILTRGLLEVCKINPVDPVDHLVLG